MRSSTSRILMFCFILGIIPSAITQTSTGKTNFHKLNKLGTTSIGAASRSSFNSNPQTRVRQHPDLVAARRGAMASGLAFTASANSGTLSVPTPKPNAVGYGGVRLGFEGMTTVDTANTNGFVLSPPDQGLCVGNGFVMEPINLVMSIYSTSGVQLTSPVALNAFLAPIRRSLF